MKKTIAAFLLCIIVFSLFPVISLAAPFSQGDGTESNPYGISTPEELNAVRDYPNAYFVLLNDIDMSEATSEGGAYWNEGAGWEPIGDSTIPFAGIFDGGGYAVLNLYINNPSTSYIGLFGNNTGSVIRLGIVDCQINADNDVYEEIYVGSVAGSSSGTISECYNTGDIIASCFHAEVGGIAGYASKVQNCFNTGRICGYGFYANVGGIVGLSGTVEKCYNMGSVPLSYVDAVGAIVGRGGTLSDCYYNNASLPGLGNRMWGSQTNIAYKNKEDITQQSELEGFDFENTWIMSMENSYPCPILRSVRFVARDVNTTDFAGGVGTIFDPFQIKTLEQLNNVRNHLGDHYILMNNIDMEEATSEGGAFYNEGLGWIPIGDAYLKAFCGSFDGNGFTIGGMTCKDISENGNALFMRNDGSINNLGMKDVKIESSGKAAAIAIKNSGIIKNCYSQGEIYGQNNCGGIAAESGGIISCCYNTADIISQSSYETAGGIVGYLEDYGNVSFCYNTGNIELLNLSGHSGVGSAGGIAGDGDYSDSTLVDNCFNIGAICVQDSGDDAGGIAGSDVDNISHCYNIGQVRGSDNSAAIISVANSVDDTYFLDTGEDDLVGALNGTTELSNKKTNEEMIDPATFLGFDFDSVWEMPLTGCYLYPVIKGLSLEPLQGETEMFAGGLGTMASPYIISTPEQLNNIRYYDYKYFILANDIDMTAATTEGGAYYNDGLGFEPIGSEDSFHIHFDGNGHTISGLHINRPQNTYIGLFGRISSSLIENLSMDDVDIAGAYNCGGIVGSCDGDIIKCTVSGRISGTIDQPNYGIGGIAGVMYGDISYCANRADIFSYVKAGGIVGDIEGDISSCANYGEVTGLGTHVIGGIAGETHGKIQDCYNTANLFQTNADEASGGISGWHFSPVGKYSYINCYSIGQSTYGITACVWLNTTLWTNCYYIDDVVDACETYGTPINASDLENIATYTGFDFTNVWTMEGESSYPYAELRNITQPEVSSIENLDLGDYGDNSTIVVGNYETGHDVVITNETGESFSNIRIVSLPGITLTLNDVKINNTRNFSPLKFSDNNNKLILAGDCSLVCSNDKPGIEAEEGTSLEIMGAGSLNVSGGTGIGAGPYRSAGNITINSGTISALGKNGAGIGGGEEGDGGNVIIKGGTVDAKGRFGGAGIGGGYAGDGGIIHIEGGIITASSGDGAGIGGGAEGDGGTITISGGMITATGSSTGIGGRFSNDYRVVIDGGIVYAATRFTLFSYDIGNLSNKVDSVAISGDSVVFLKNGTIKTPLTTTHTKYTQLFNSGNKAFGFDIPSTWTAPVYAYLNSSNVADLSYNANGGSGTAPSGIAQYHNTSAKVSGGNDLKHGSLNFVCWNTKDDGTGVDYYENDELLFLGNTVLYAKYEEKIPIEELSLNSHSETLITGNYISLSATVSPSNVTYPTVTWSSSNSSVATVDQNGKVTAVAPGTATITATADGVSDTCKITVQKKAVTSVSLSSQSSTMEIGNSISLKATVSPSDATNKKVSWSSSNTAVASVDQNGRVTALSVGSATITATADGVSDTCQITVSSAFVSYQSHVQNIGWQDWKKDGNSSGTSGQSLRLEAMRIKLDGIDGGIEYRTHVQNIGWMDWASNGALSGTSGQSLRLEAIRIRLTGAAAEKYDVYYRVHAQNFGWMGWAKNGESSGTAGYSYRLEAIQIKLVAKGGAAPGSSTDAFVDYNAKPSTVSVIYQSHVQNIGWQDWMNDGESSGTSGQSLRLEGMCIKLDNIDGGIEYQTHVQNIGWMDWVSNGTMSGTSGRSLRLEAIKIRLTGAAAEKYDVYYRVHAQNFGWMGWAKNGESAGTAGFGYRLEAIQIFLVSKSGAAPGSTANAFIQNGN